MQLCNEHQWGLTQDLSAALLTAVQDACSVLLDNCNRIAAGNKQHTINSVISLAKDGVSASVGSSILQFTPPFMGTMALNIAAFNSSGK